ncbi:hypothetical protein Bbelb_384610 [Branchiostoma belcheri]|nr:hypothetical protein Bbelb_384610 [Branchiostoma belcheri]
MSPASRGLVAKRELSVEPGLVDMNRRSDDIKACPGGLAPVVCENITWAGIDMYTPRAVPPVEGGAIVTTYLAIVPPGKPVKKTHTWQCCSEHERTTLQEGCSSLFDTATPTCGVFYDDEEDVVCPGQVQQNHLSCPVVQNTCWLTSGKTDVRSALSCVGKEHLARVVKIQQ